MNKEINVQMIYSEKQLRIPGDQDFGKEKKRKKAINTSIGFWDERIAAIVLAKSIDKLQNQFIWTL